MKVAVARFTASIPHGLRLAILALPPPNLKSEKQHVNVLWLIALTLIPSRDVFHPSDSLTDLCAGVPC